METHTKAPSPKMTHQLAPADLAPHIHNAKERRSWGYFNIPWAWEPTKMEARSVVEENGAFKSIVHLPTNELDTDGSGDLMRGRMITRVTYQKTLPLEVNPGQAVTIRSASEWSVQHTMRMVSTRMASLRYRFGFQTSWRLYAEILGEEQQLELVKQGDTLFEHTGLLETPNNRSQSIALGSANTPQAQHVFESRTWSIDHAIKEVTLHLSFWLNIGLTMNGVVQSLIGALPDQQAIIAAGTLKQIDLAVIDAPEDDT